MIDQIALDNGIARSAMAKAMWRILPLILVAYVMAYMDRVNVSFAALKMNADLGFSATVYGLGGGLFFVGYALFEVPSGALAVRYSPRRWLARIMVTWGLLAVGMMFIHSATQFYIMRFLLGVAEAGFFPGILYHFASWFPTAYRGRSISRIYIAPALASIIIGSVSASLLDLDGLNGWRGWQWLFLAQGMPAVLMGLILLRFLPDTPAEVSWLTAPEKAWLQRELARDALRIGVPERHTILAALTNRWVLMLGPIGFIANAATIGVLLSAPAILTADTGLDSHAVGRIISIGGVLGAGCILFAGWFSDRHGDRFRDGAAWGVAVALGIGLMALAPTPAVVIVGYLVFAGAVFAYGMLNTSLMADVIHVRHLAVGVGAINTIWQFGSFLSPYAFGAAKDATGSFHAGLLGLMTLALVNTVYALYLRSRVMGQRRRLAQAAA